MTHDVWNAISAVGSVTSGIAALLGLPFIGWQVRAARKTSDLQALQSFSLDMQKCEEKLFMAQCARSKELAFNELLNFLELNAAAFNAGLFHRTTRKLVREKLRDSILVIQEAGEWHQKFEAAITTETTFSEILKFMEKERRYLKNTKIRP